jgi:hypothetical protein
MPRGWTWLGIAAATLVGMVLGILLTIVSVILPQADQMGRQRVPSRFVMGFSPRTLIEQVSPVKVGRIDEVLDREQPGFQPWGRTFETTLSLSPMQQDLFVSQLNNQIASALRNSGVNSWSSGSRSTVGPRSDRSSHHSLQYDRGGRAGAIHVWTVAGDGDVLVLISLHER